ncbi:Os04g0143566 [Oryza sativa Japonica Group]|uniref:Os04g0143566 protein n=1 Tax=Oryza sativa subsp. japonica TaxID=39947 RepID=A0A0P0W6F5_ORYSJ|nr:Os04g0143566 [Oryza sativa Japonica Group]
MPKGAVEAEMEHHQGTGGGQRRKDTDAVAMPRVDDASLGVHDVVQQGELHLEDNPRLVPTPLINCSFLVPGDINQRGLARAEIGMSLKQGIVRIFLAHCRWSGRISSSSLLAVSSLLLPLCLLLLLLLNCAPDGAQVPIVERPYPLPVLDNTDDEHQPRRGRKHSQAAAAAAAGRCDENGVAGGKDLGEESGQQQAQPELVVLDGVGADVIRATKVDQQQRRPERQQLLALPRHQRAVDGEVAEAI